jgi:hypothetical protein
MTPSLALAPRPPAGSARSSTTERAPGLDERDRRRGMPSAEPPSLTGWALAALARVRRRAPGTRGGRLCREISRHRPGGSRRSLSTSHRSGARRLRHPVGTPRRTRLPGVTRPRAGRPSTHATGRRRTRCRRRCRWLTSRERSRYARSS